MSSSLLQPLLDSARVARLLGVEVETLGAWRRKGFGPPWHRIGKRVRYTETDLRIWMDAQAKRGRAPCPDSTEGCRSTDIDKLHISGSPTPDLEGRR